MTGRNLTEIVVTPEGIDIITDGPVNTYTAFPMTKPNRMVVDLPGVRLGISVNKLHIGSFGIDTARLGRYEEKSRVVFVGDLDTLYQDFLADVERYG